MLIFWHRTLFHYSVVFFFYWYGDHRDLHKEGLSFPTRRSSDLFAVLGELDALVVAGHPEGDPQTGANRSEEHTSELQSPFLTSYAVFCLKTKKNTRSCSHRRRRHGQSRYNAAYDNA